MANSLRNKIKHLCYKGELSERERDRLLNALDDADRINSELKPCEDCISRKEALKHSHIEYDDDGEGHRVIYVEDIEDLPSVTPKPKVGHWEDCSNGWMCSNCYKDVSHESDFCPNCGAKMAESEDEG